MSKFLKIGIFLKNRSLEDFDNSKILLKKLYFLTVKDKLSTGHVVKMPCPKVNIKEHAKLHYIQAKSS